MALNLAETIARSACYKLLSLAFLPPGKTAPGLFSGLDRIIADLPEDHRTALRPLILQAAGFEGPADGEYSRLFGVSLAATPYETEYDPLASVRKGHRLADLLGFYEAFGFRLSEDAKEFPDHIAVELEFMAVLLLKTAQAQLEGREEATAVCREATGKFLADHLGGWGMAFADRVEAATEDMFYRFAARLLRAFIRAECRLLGVEALPPAASAPRDPGPLACPFVTECSQEV